MTEVEWLTREKNTAAKTGQPYREVRQRKEFTRNDKNGDGLITREQLEKGRI